MIVEFHVCKFGKPQFAGIVPIRLPSLRTLDTNLGVPLTPLRFVNSPEQLGEAPNLG